MSVGLVVIIRRQILLTQLRGNKLFWLYTHECMYEGRHIWSIVTQQTLRLTLTITWCLALDDLLGVCTP